MENFPNRATDNSWRSYLLVLGLVFGVLIALQMMGLTKPERSDDAVDGQLRSHIQTGDYQLKMALSEFPGIGSEQTTRIALATYQRAEPLPAAYRRIGIVRETLLSEPGMESFERLADRRTIRAVGADRAQELSQEAQMWREVFGPDSITQQQASEYVNRINRLELGPLEGLAVSAVHRKAGMDVKADAVRRKARNDARTSIYIAAGLVLLMGALGLVGIGLTGLFMSRYGRELAQASPPGLQIPVLMLTFLAFIFGLIFFEVLGAAIIGIAGVDLESALGNVMNLVVQGLSSLGAFILGLAALRTLTAYTGEDPGEMGLKKMPVGEAVKWGVGGYAALLPFWVIAAVVAQYLSNTLFRNLPMPVDPFTPVIRQGGLGVAILFILAAIIAPVVEETFFRGALYTGLRTRMSVWGAAFLSSALFAAVHPFPFHFIPILVVGVVLAILREKTGSLMPAMICHSLYNIVVLLLAYLVYG